ncbi:hypothetical protein Tco_0541816, partial [Tanacetum coccineum]
FLNLSSDSSLVSTVKDFADADVSSLLDIPIQQETHHTQSPSVQKVPILVILETLIPTPPITTNAPTIMTAVPESNALTAVKLRVEKLDKDVSELKIIDHSSKALV